ncbi:E3 ubiquitin-protein ligase BOI [Trifolium repens]|nr:E3 ubiquitin-protein ligase BOI [Trifolium repens]
MAVQAQYPSNVHEYSLQPQPDQSNNIILFNTPGTNNSRKRGRETGVIQSSHNIMNPFSLQSHSPHLIDLTQLHNQQHQNIVSTGLGSQIKQQKDEIDQFLQAQGEELQRTLEEKRQRNYRAIIKTAEETVARRLREKEIDLEKATRRNMELESRAAHLRNEMQLWQAKAKEQEATAISLQNQLHHAMMSVGAENRGEEGCGLSCALGVEGQAEDAESGYIDPDRVVISGHKCKGCEKRVASVVVLPCRHLCVCNECDTHFRVCPVCLTVKNSTVEIYLS